MFIHIHHEEITQYELPTDHNGVSSIDESMSNQYRPKQLILLASAGC